MDIVMDINDQILLFCGHKDVNKSCRLVYFYGYLTTLVKTGAAPFTTVT